MDLAGVKIAEKNTKLGKIANVSLVPGKDCLRGVPCAKFKECYALKFYAMYPSVKQRWDANSQYAHSELQAYFDSIVAQIQALPVKRQKYFRYHVAGDILSQAYLDGMIAVAIQLPDTQFLAFTKRDDLDYSKLPPNLKIIFSQWVGLQETPTNMPKAWVRDESNLDNRIPSNAFECPGKCDKCYVCWSTSTDIVFNKH